MRITAVCLVVIALAAACSDAADVTVEVDASTATTASAAPSGVTETLARRDTPLGELVVTRGPATQPWRFDPNGPTDRWREPAACYAPRITVRIGGRSATIGDWPTDDGEIVVGAVFARAEPDDPLAAMAVLAFGAVDGATYSLQRPDTVDRTVADGSVAVLVDPVERDTAGNGGGPFDFLVRGPTPRGGDEELPFDLASAENAFYAGDVNTCPGHTGVTPRPTVAPPGDAADAAAAAARAFDPATPRSEAQSMYARVRHVASELDAFLARIVQQARAFGLAGYRVELDARTEPVFHSADDAWIPLALVADGSPAPFGFWAKVDRTADGWQVDGRSICAAFDQLAFGTPPATCDG